MPAELQTTLDFLRELRENNTREWFNANRPRYETARAAFENFIADVLHRFPAVEDVGNLTPAQTMYRINRDVRFSPDKSPYKTTMGALIGKEGRKSTGRSYYFHLEPGGQSMIAGGLYMPEAKQLDKFRQAVAEDSRPLRDILDSDTFKRYFVKIAGEQLKTAPKGYPKDHPALDLLRYKQLTVIHYLTDEKVLEENLADYVIEVNLAMQPFIHYLFEVVA